MKAAQPPRVKVAPGFGCQMSIRNVCVFSRFVCVSLPSGDVPHFRQQRHLERLQQVRRQGVISANANAVSLRGAHCFLSVTCSLSPNDKEVEVCNSKLIPKQNFFFTFGLFGIRSY